MLKKVLPIIPIILFSQKVVANEADLCELEYGLSCEHMEEQRRIYSKNNKTKYSDDNVDTYYPQLDEILELWNKTKKKKTIKESYNFNSNKYGLNKTFKRNIERLEDYIGTQRGNLFRVIEIESNFNPYAINSKSGAQGYIQLLEKHTKEYGILDLRGLINSTTPEFQFQSTVFAYFNHWFNIHKIDRLPDKSIGTLYLMISAPAKLKSRDDEVVYRKGSLEYEFNTLWDSNNDGETSVKEIKQFPQTRK